MMIPTFSDVLEIANFIHKLGYRDGNITVECEVENQEELNKANEEFFYKLNMDENGKIDPNPDEINIKIGSINFRYFKKEQN